MDKKKALPGPVRVLLLIVQHLLLATATVCTIILLSNLAVQDDRTGAIRSYELEPFSEASCFEDTYTFRMIFKDQISDAISSIVIGGQLGEKGSYDGENLIDITAYANRKDLEYEGSDITAVYLLEDLLRWYNNGFEYEAVKANLYGKADEETTNNAVKEKYLPVDGVPLRERVDTWEDYYLLLGSLEVAVNDLGYNYSIYNSVKDSLVTQNTNFRYACFIPATGGETKVFTNSGVTSIKEAEEYFVQKDGYATYDLKDLSFRTNIKGFSEESIRWMFERYEYVFRENAKFYFCVDTTYPANDTYKTAVVSFAVLQNVWTYIGISVVSLIIWFFLLIFLSVMAGRKKDKEGEVVLEAQWFDYVPTEIMLILAAVVMGVFVAWFFVVYYGISDFFHEIVYGSQEEAMRNVAVFIALLFSLTFSMFWYSFIRRLKMHTFWSNSLCARLVKWIWGLMKALWRQLTKCYDNKGILVRAVSPIIFLVFVNMIGGSLAVLFIIEGLRRGRFVYAFVGIMFLMPVVVIDIVYSYIVVKASISRKKIVDGIIRIREGEMDYQLNAEEMHGENRALAEAVNSIGNGIKKAVETSMKDERMKTDLITNVSHDIKTPLTSIINYVGLLKREKIETEPVKGYIEVLDAKSQRLKQLTDDLVEASKISSGNIVLNIERINLAELLKQSVGEFSEKFEQKNLTIVETYEDEVFFINADPARMWRVIENLFNNIFKYSLEGTRVYVELTRNIQNEERQIILSVKNISKNPLCVKPEELTERFIRGDESRTTEGSGLGLSIAKSLVEVQGGKLNIILDGDLFKVVLNFYEMVEEIQK